ncbi:MAG: hypothetical protein HY320_11950 [Armatimonadetes bacterium]|nr:hypothetical protein [Armatimonadota bacterium]
MALRINYNATAFTAHRFLEATDGQMKGSITRLSSGFRVNTASDDPAGLVISENLRAQAEGLSQAIRNSSDAINMVKTAEAALADVNSLLRQMRNLALHAANTGANDSVAVSADQAQIDEAISSINRIANDTQYGKIKLLNGSAANLVQFSGSNADLVTEARGSTLADGSHTLELSNYTDASATITGNLGLTSPTNIVGLAGGAHTITVTNVGGNNNVIELDGHANTFVDADVEDTDVITLQDADGNTIDLTVDTALAIGTANVDVTAQTFDVAVDGGSTTVTFTAGEEGTALTDDGKQVKLTFSPAITDTDTAFAFTTDDNSLYYQVGANANQTVKVGVDSVKAAVLGNATLGWVSEMDVTTASGAQDAIKILDKAIDQVSKLRSTLGAFQKNTLESSINSLSVAEENMRASESTIRDADMAAEMMQFTRDQILLQAGTAMLAQANQSSQVVLTLLR